MQARLLLSIAQLLAEADRTEQVEHMKSTRSRSQSVQGTGLSVFQGAVGCGCACTHPAVIWGNDLKQA
jgi:hypothetical protein